MLRKFFNSRRPPPPPRASLPPGTRVYGIGDIHGRLDLLDALLDRIEQDESNRHFADTQLVFLGDLIDRGPDSAGVIERLRQLAEQRPAAFLTGNHEEVFLAALAGDLTSMRLFCRVGGRETALSYGLAEQDYDRMDYAELAAWLAAAVPASHQAFLASFEDLIVMGDYAFVHAGVRPGVALSAQSKADLRWIREPFLSHDRAFERMIVHGHTISDAVEYRPGRIGIDTGAYATGRLTALGLQDGDRWELRS